MKRFAVLILACSLALGCQPEPEPQPAPSQSDREAGGAPAPATPPAVDSTPEASPSQPAPSQPEPEKKKRPDFPPSLRPLYDHGAHKLVAAIKALPKPLSELRLARPLNKTRYRLDPRMLTNFLMNRLVKLRELPVVELETAPWVLESTISSEELEHEGGFETTYFLQLEVVDRTAGKTVAKVEASMKDLR